MRREWIEMYISNVNFPSISVSLHAEGVDWNEQSEILMRIVEGLPPCGGSGLKYQSLHRGKNSHWSPSMRREWIEIPFVRRNCEHEWSPSMRREWIEITNRTDSDSGTQCLPPCGGSGLKWNCVHQKAHSTSSPSMRREWIEIPPVGVPDKSITSPSMRREWIEIWKYPILWFSDWCLPPCGGSGLKYYYFSTVKKTNVSPSMRREWIEMWNEKSNEQLG